VSVTLCGALRKVKDEGEALNPDGRPDADTETVPLKPSRGLTDTCTVDEAPGAIAGEDGVAEISKAGGGGGGEPDDPPPHAENKTESPITRILANRRPIGCRRESCRPPRLCLRVLVNAITSCPNSRSRQRKWDLAGILIRCLPCGLIGEYHACDLDFEGTSLG